MKIIIPHNPSKSPMGTVMEFMKAVHDKRDPVNEIGQDIDITFGDFAILHYLYENGRQLAKDIQSKAGFSTNISYPLSKLSRLGYLESEVPKNDQRKRYYRLTDTGVGVLESMVRDIEADMDSFIGVYYQGGEAPTLRIEDTTTELE